MGLSSNLAALLAACLVSVPLCAAQCDLEPLLNTGFPFVAASAGQLLCLNGGAPVATSLDNLVVPEGTLCLFLCSDDDTGSGSIVCGPDGQISLQTLCSAVGEPDPCDADTVAAAVEEAVGAPLTVDCLFVSNADSNLNVPSLGVCQFDCPAGGTAEIQCSNNAQNEAVAQVTRACPSSSASSSVSPSPSPSLELVSPSASESASTSPSPSPSPSLVILDTPSSSASLSLTSSTSLTPSASPSLSLSSSASGSASPTPAASLSGSASPSFSPSLSLTPSLTPSASPSASLSLTSSVSLTPSPSPSPSPSSSASLSPSPSPSLSLSSSASPSVSASPSISPSPSVSPSVSPSISVSPSASPSVSLSPSASPSPSPSPSTSVPPFVVVASVEIEGADAADYEDPNVREAFKEGVAQAAGVSPDRVIINDIIELQAKQAGVRIDYSITSTSQEEADEIQANVSEAEDIETAFNDALEDRGVNLVIDVQAANAEVQVLDNNNGGGGGGGSDVGVFVGIGVGAAVICVGAASYFMTKNKGSAGGKGKPKKRKGTDHSSSPDQTYGATMIQLQKDGTAPPRRTTETEGHAAAELYDRRVREKENDLLNDPGFKQEDVRSV